jgi:hypothetical protein
MLHIIGKHFSLKSSVVVTQEPGSHAIAIGNEQPILLILPWSLSFSFRPIAAFSEKMEQ